MGIRTLVRALKFERREHGWKGLVKRRGWKLVLLFVVFYLVRDLILYVLIPFAVYAGVSR